MLKAGDRVVTVTRAPVRDSVTELVLELPPRSVGYVIDMYPSRFTGCALVDFEAVEGLAQWKRLFVPYQALMLDRAESSTSH